MKKYYWVYACGPNDMNIDLWKFADKDSAGNTYNTLVKYGRPGVSSGMIRKKMTEKEAVAYANEHFPNHNVVVGK